MQTRRVSDFTGTSYSALGIGQLERQQDCSSSDINISVVSIHLYKSFLILFSICGFSEVNSHPLHHNFLP